MKSIEKLPERWCIKLLPENQEVIGKYFDKQTNCKRGCYVESRFTNKYLVSHDGRSDYVVNGCGANVGMGYDKPDGWVEISFEDFKKWVLGQEEEVIYEIY